VIDIDYKSRCRVLISNIEGPVNLGMTARNMANTDFKNLSFTGPLTGKEKDCHKYALQAYNIISDSIKCDNFNDLVAGSDIVIGFSPRTPWDYTPPAEYIDLAKIVNNEINSGNTVGLLFGSENNGLTNEELSVCKYRMALPSSKEFESINLSQAIMIVLWTLHTSSISFKKNNIVKSASGDDRRIFLDKLKEILKLSDYFYKNNENSRWQEILQIFESKDWKEREIKLLISAMNKIKNELKNQA